MSYKPMLLFSDVLFFLCLLLIVLGVSISLKKQLVADAYRELFKRSVAIISFIILALFTTIAVLDSVHFNYDGKTISLFDRLMSHRSQKLEKTYSAPLSLSLYVKETATFGGQFYPRLKHIPDTIKTIADRNHDILMLTLKAIGISLLLILFCYWFFYHRLNKKIDYKVLGFGLVLFFSVFELGFLSSHYHVFGTGKVGQDIFYYTLKSIRTGLIIGLLTTFVILPFALILGIYAGFFGGIIDDIIQFIYITISSIPGVLLIAASVLSMQFLSVHILNISKP